MASPQAENGHTDIANELMERLSHAELNGSEFRICFCILRKTWGWHKKSDEISITQIQDMTGLSRKMTVETLNKLVTKKLLVKTQKYINTLQFNKNFEEWLVTNRTLGSYEKVTRVVTNSKPKLVTNSEHTKEKKETITKEIIHKNVLGFGNPDINELMGYFLKVMQLPKEDCSEEKSRRYWSNLMKENGRGVDGVKALIDLASQDAWYKNNITSSMDLYYKRIKLVSRKGGKHMDSQSLEKSDSDFVIGESWEKKYYMRVIGQEEEILITEAQRNNLIDLMASGKKYVMIGEYLVMINSIQMIRPRYEPDNVPPRPKNNYMLDSDNKYSINVNEEAQKEWDKLFLDNDGLKGL